MKTPLIRLIGKTQVAKSLGLFLCGCLAGGFVASALRPARPAPEVSDIIERRDAGITSCSGGEGMQTVGTSQSLTFSGVPAQEIPSLPLNKPEDSGLSASEAWRMLEEVLSGSLSLTALGESDWLRVVGELAEQDPDRALEIALLLPSGQLSHALCVEGFESLAKLDGTAAWSALSRLGPGSLEEDASLAVLRVWAETDPRAAAWAAASVDPQNPYQIAAVAGLWAAKEPDAALAWAASISGSASLEAVAEAARAAAGTAGDRFHPADMERLLAGLSDAEQRAAASAAVAGELWMIDEDAALAWVSRLRGTERVPAVVALSEARSPALAAHLAEALVPLLADGSSGGDTGALSYALATVAEDYASLDAPAAMQWAMSLNAEFRDEAINLAIESWTERDPAAAGDWLQREPLSPASTAARHAFAGSLATRDPQAALAWARSCPPSPERETLIGFLSVQALALE